MEMRGSWWAVYPHDAGIVHTLDCTKKRAVIMPDGRCRLILPVETERLMGFPDGYTDVPFKGKPAPNALRFKALGNSMAVPVMRWIGKRIQFVDSIKEEGC